jgi:hypothetical protein
MAIVCVEQSRTTLPMVTLPYTVSIPVSVSAPGGDYIYPGLSFTAHTLAGYADLPVVETGLHETTVNDQFGPIPTSYDGLVLDELSATSATAADFGTAAPTTSSYFHLWDGKIFYAAVLTESGGFDSYSYMYADFATGSNPTITWTNVPGFPSEISGSIAILPTPAPISWSGLTSPVVLLTMTEWFSAGTIKAKAVSASGLSTINPLATFDETLGDNFAFDMVQPGTGRNWFLSRGLDDPAFMYRHAASNVDGSTLASDTVTFSDAGVNLALTGGNERAGFWTVIPGFWVWYGSRHAFDVLTEVVTPQNGVVVIKISMDCTQYWVYFLRGAVGDTNAITVLDNATTNPRVVFDTVGTIFYMDPTYGTAGSVLSPGSDGISTPTETTTSTLDMSGAPLTTPPNPESVWILTEASVPARKFRVLTRTEKEPAQWEISAVVYDAMRRARIESLVPTSGILFAPSFLDVASAIEPPSDLRVDNVFTLLQGLNVMSTIISWAPPHDPRVVAHQIAVTDSNNVVTTVISQDLSFQVPAAARGIYRYKVRAASADGRFSSWVDVQIGDEPPFAPLVPAPTNFQAIATSATTVSLSWDAVPEAAGYRITRCNRYGGALPPVFVPPDTINTIFPDVLEITPPLDITGVGAGICFTGTTLTDHGEVNQIFDEFGGPRTNTLLSQDAWYYSVWAVDEAGNQLSKIAGPYPVSTIPLMVGTTGLIWRLGTHFEVGQYAPINNGGGGWLPTDWMGRAPLRPGYVFGIPIYATGTIHATPFGFAAPYWLAHTESVMAIDQTITVNLDKLNLDGTRSLIPLGNITFPAGSGGFTLPPDLGPANILTDTIANPGDIVQLCLPTDMDTNAGSWMISFLMTN